MSAEREPGWYWVKDKGGWCPARFTDEFQWAWWRSDEYPISEEWFEEIGPRFEEPKT